MFELLIRLWEVLTTWPEGTIGCYWQAALAIVGAGVSIYGGAQARKSANRNASLLQQNAAANAADIQRVGDLNASIVEHVAGLNASALKGVSDFNAQQVLKTSRINAGFIAYGAAYEANLQEYDASIADSNAKVASQNRAIALENGQYNAARIHEENQRTIGAQRAGFAKSGVILDGSAYDVLYDSAIQGTLDTLLAIHSADIIAYGFLIDQINSQNQAALLNFKADATRQQGALESVYALYQGNAQAEAILYEGYTRANITLAEGTLQSSLIRATTQADVASMLRSGSAGASSVRSQGQAAFNKGLADAFSYSTSIYAAGGGFAGSGTGIASTTGRGFGGPR